MSLTHWRGGPRLKSNWMHSASMLKLSNKRSMLGFCVAIRRGVGDYLTVLTAQRSLWSAQQELLALQLTDFTNRITLWQSLGGGMSSLK